MYLKEGNFDVQLLGRGFPWRDTGTMDSLFEVLSFVKIIDQRQDIRIFDSEKIAYHYTLEGVVSLGTSLNGIEPVLDDNDRIVLLLN